MGYIVLQKCINTQVIRVFQLATSTRVALFKGLQIARETFLFSVTLHLTTEICRKCLSWPKLFAG